MITDEEIINTIILTRLSYFHLNTMVELYKQLGSATEIIQQRDHLKTTFPGLPQRIADDLMDAEAMRPRAVEELAYCREHDIQMLCMNDAKYPKRLTECTDPPLMLFYKGQADLNRQHVIAVVGTRHCTTYGQDLIRSFLADLSRLCPDTLIVSGLAYGVDIHAHRDALDNNMDTVAVLAHGLDDLYPPRHRDTANEMVFHGGLLTEYMTHTKIDKLNFVRRNRITAGLSDATIVVESAEKGGGLITARISREYNRDVFAFPGPVGAPYSEGCNHMIRDNGAALITSAVDFVKAMGWQDELQINQMRKAGIERQMFPELDEEEQKITTLLQAQNDLPANIIAVKTALNIGTIQAKLFSLEMKGVVKPYAGGFYHLLK